MTEEQFEATYPHIIGWITQILDDHKSQVRSVASMGFQRLPLYFPPAVLETAKVVHVDAVPMPPLSSIGLNQFADFEQMDAAGITYLDTFFIRDEYKERESIYFHELVHVAQWSILGAKSFVAAYAAGLERHGYRQSPLEVMAYELEAAFLNEAGSFDAIRLVDENLATLYGKQ